jgi:hypothetical protein
VFVTSVGKSKPGLRKNTAVSDLHESAVSISVIDGMDESSNMISSTGRLGVKA